MGEVSWDRLTGTPQPLHEGDFEGVAYAALCGDEEQAIRMRVKAVRNADHAYLITAWINTNAAVAPSVLDQWLTKVSFAPTPSAYPTNAKAFQTFHERERHALLFFSLGEQAFTRRDFDRSAAAFRNSLECRFLPGLLSGFVESNLDRGHPEEIVEYIKGRGPFAMAHGYIVLDLAYAESRAGDSANALIHYTKCLASGSYTSETMPERYFEDYVRCLVKEGRTKWATTRLRERIQSDRSLAWPRLLEQLNLEAPSGSAAPSAPGGAVMPATNPPAAASPPTESPRNDVPKLKGILWNPTRPSAQVDGALLFLGESVRGHKLIKIRWDSVDLISPDGRTVTLEMKH